MGELTILLIPPSDDPALLADECGGRVPQLQWGPRCERDRDGYTRSGALGWWPPEQVRPGYGNEFAIVLVHEGAPVRLGIFRAWDMADDLSSDDLGAALTMEPAEIAEWVAALRRNNKPIGRIVLLRDGREVAK